jgi:hypothetical protein
MCGQVHCDAGSTAPLRIFSCARCGLEAQVCAECDRGQIYCAGDCRVVRRRESRWRAGMRYQRSRRGAQKHAARQRRWRVAKSCAQKVTHHGFPKVVPIAMVAASPEHVSVPADEEERDGGVADDGEDRGAGAEAPGDEPGGGRSAEGAPSHPAATPTGNADAAGGSRTLERGAPLRCDFCGRAPDAWLGSEDWCEELWPAESPLVRFDFAIPPARVRRPIRGVGDFRDVRRQLRLVWSR